jgi:hypothetical protein
MTVDNAPLFLFGFLLIAGLQLWIGYTIIKNAVAAALREHTQWIEKRDSARAKYKDQSDEG